MIVEEREYKIAVGKLADFWALYSNVGLAIQTKYIGPPIGFFSIEIGEITSFVHMWGYKSLADREARRELLHQDPAWQEYVPRSRAFIVAMHNRILKSFEAPENSGTLVSKWQARA